MDFHGREGMGLCFGTLKRGCHGANPRTKPPLDFGKLLANFSSHAMYKPGPGFSATRNKIVQNMYSRKGWGGR